MSKELDQSSPENKKLFSTKKRKRGVIKADKSRKMRTKKVKLDSEIRESKMENESQEEEHTNNQIINEVNMNSTSNINLPKEKSIFMEEEENEGENNQDNLIIESAIKKLKNDDPDYVLNFLYELTNQLSMADESVAENKNCTTLVKDLLNIFEKFNQSELSIQSLIAINFLIDIHPYFCHVIVKNDGVKKIVELTQNVEYIDLAENAIKTIEKISHEHPISLLEKDAFNHILMFVDFFEDNIKKYVVASCHNMTKYIRKFEILEKFILPAIPSLTSLTKSHIDTELQKNNLDKSINCFYNIFHSIKTYKFYQNDPNIWGKIIHNGLIDNLIEILINFFKIINEKNSNNKNRKNHVINMETFKNILRIFQLLSEQSAKISNILINMNILEMIYTIFKEELEENNLNQKNVNGKMVTSHHSIFNELFPFIQSLFPNENEEEKRLLIDNSSNVYIFFSQKIIPLLIENFIKISSSNISIKALKLINVYCHYSTSENLKRFVNPSKLANIMSKMLDSKDVTNMMEVYEMIDTLMKRSSEVFLVDLIRDGVVGNINEINNLKKEEVFFPSDNLFISKLFDKYKNIIDNEEKENIVNKINNEMDVDKEEKEIYVEELDNIIVINEDKITTNKSVLNNEDKILLIIKSLYKEISDKYFNEEFTQNIFKSLNIIDSKNNPNKIIYNLIQLSAKIKSSPKDKLDKNIIDELFYLLLDDNKITFHEIEKSQIIKNLVNYIDKNFEINIAQKKNIQNLKYEKNIVEKLKIIFTSLNKNSEKIKKLMNLLQYCISSMNCFKVCLYEYSTYKNASHLFLSAYKNQNQKYPVQFVYQINEEVLDEYGLDPNLQELHLFYSNDQTKKTIEIDQMETFTNLQEAILKREYKGNPLDKEKINKNQSDLYDDEILKTLRSRKGSEDFENTERLLSQMLERKQSIIEEENVNSNLLPISLRSNERSHKRIKYSINFYVEILDKKLFINKKWNFNDAVKEIKNNFNKRDYLEFFKDIKFKFEIVVKDDLIEIGNARKSSMNISPIQLKLKLEDSCHDIITQHTKENFVEEILFSKFYHEKIISNQALYSVTRASPFIYLIAILELCINQYPNLFKLKDKLDETALENSKISSLLIKQVRDPYAISSNSVPHWCKDLSQSFPFISNFNSRYVFFKTCTFDLKRSMTNLYVYIQNLMGETISDDKTLANNKRRKFVIDRENIILSTEKLIRELGNFTGYIEFEYLFETGSGLGPTLEYYSLFIKEMMKNKIWYKSSDNSLFPAPFLNNKIGFEENEKLFSLLGFVVARSLYDDRLIDVPFNSLFWDIVLERPLSYSKIYKIDKDLGKVINDFIDLINLKHEFISNNDHTINFNEKILYNNTKIEDIGINFVIPGYNHIELKENGENTLVNADNLEEFVNLVFDSICVEGIKDSIIAFKKGFNIVFNINSLSCFTSDELGDILCGSHSENWDYETLYENVVPNHGYDKNSPTFKYLIDFLINLDNKQKKKFLSFVTGSSRLPLGGFRNLNPKLTIVKRSPDIQNENADKYLPTVMTCQNYLKIPEYSSYQTFTNRLETAMNEGGNSFDLS